MPTYCNIYTQVSSLSVGKYVLTFVSFLQSLLQIQQYLQPTKHLVPTTSREFGIRIYPKHTNSPPLSLHVLTTTQNQKCSL